MGTRATVPFFSYTRITLNPHRFKKSYYASYFFYFFLHALFVNCGLCVNCFLSVLKCLIVSSLYSVFLCGPFVTLCNTKNLLCVSFGFFCVSVYSAVSNTRVLHSGILCQSVCVYLLDLEILILVPSWRFSKALVERILFLKLGQ